MAIVELLLQGRYFFVVKDAIALKLVCEPFSFICEFSISIVENSSALHSVLIPLPTVFASVTIIESSKSLPIFSKLVSLVLSFLKVLSYVLRVDLLWTFFEWSLV